MSYNRFRRVLTRYYKLYGETMIIDNETLEKSREVVLEKDPETLYRVMNALYTYNPLTSPEVKDRREKEFAHYIRVLYIDGNKIVPDEIEQLIEEIATVAETFEDEETEILGINYQAEAQAFIKKNGLTKLVDLLVKTLESEDSELETEFIYEFMSAGNTLPGTLDELVIIYHTWLLVNISA